MKIKGVYKDKHKKGEPIEYAPAEKVPLAVIDAIATSAKEGELLYVEGMADGVKVSKTHHIKSDHPLPGKRPWANNIYTAEGEVTVRKLDTVKDKLKPVKKHNFKIKFRDTTDSYGMPDLKVEEFQLT